MMNSMSRFGLAPSPAIHAVKAAPAAPVLRVHNVLTLGDRVRVIRNLIWGNDPRIGTAGSLKDPLMRQIGLAVTQHCPPRNDLCELKAAFDFMSMNVRYTGDIAGKDTFQSALRTLQYGGGDCDDGAILGAVLTAENGFFSKARITSNTGATWDHIYLLTGVPKHNPRDWIAFDWTLGPNRFRSEPPRAKYEDFWLVRPGGG
jgi:hypothetical protein